MERHERRAAGTGLVAMAGVGLLAILWPDLALAGVRSVPTRAQPFVDAVLCFAPLLWAPLPAILGLWAASAPRRSRLQ